MSAWQAGKLIEECGFEFRYADPDVHSAEKGLIFGSRKVHAGLFRWFEEQLEKPAPAPAGWLSPDDAQELRLEIARLEALVVGRSPQEPSLATRTPKDQVKPSKAHSEPNKGAKAYEDRLAGRPWTDRSFMMAAKKHAKTHNLPWPPTS